MQSLFQDLRYAVRTLLARPGFTTVAVLALGLGIGANTAVFTVVNGVLLRPLPFPDHDRLYLISHSPEPGPFGGPQGLGDADYVNLAGRTNAFDSVVSLNQQTVNLAGAGEPAVLPAAGVTTGFLKVIGVNPAIGRGFLAEDTAGGTRVALISNSLWQNRFGRDPQITGKTIKLDGVSHTVIGVMPPGFDYPFHAALWTPFEIRVDPHLSFIRSVAGRLKPGVSLQQAQSEMGYLLTPLKDLQVSSVRISLLVFTGAVAFVLLIACANVANLLLIRAAAREREIAIRSALGAGRLRLIRQLLTESTLLGLAGGGAGILFALWGVPALLALAPEGKLPRLEEIHIDGRVLAFTFAVSLATGIVFGLAPAFRATTERHLHRDRPANFLRSGLVVVEIALALIVVTGAGLMLRSFLRMQAVDPGFRPNNILAMAIDLPGSVYDTPGSLRSFHDRLLQKLSLIPGATSTGAVNWRPLGGAVFRGDFTLEGGQKLPKGFLADKVIVSPGYFRTLGIRILAGRDFDQRDSSDGRGVVIVNESLARRIWPGEDAVGKRISFRDKPTAQDWLTVVAVAADIHQSELTTKPSPAIYQPYLQATQRVFLSRMNYFVRTESNPARMAGAMRQALREVDPDQPAKLIATMDHLVALTTAEPLFQARLMGAFSMLALLLAAVGIYGVLAYSVAERTREIGIRMALGAAAPDVIRMVLRRTLLLVLCGIGVGIAGALASTRVLKQFLFGVTPTDTPTFAVVAVLLAGVALVAGWAPVRRATRVDPLMALRYE